MEPEPERRIADALLDAIELSVDGRLKVVYRTPPELAGSGISAFLALCSANDLRWILPGTVARTGFSLDYVDVEMLATDTRVTALDSVEAAEIVQPAAFDRLIARLSRGIIEAAVATANRVTLTPWWPQAVAESAALHARAYPP